ncbi:hypothetical protein NQ317_012248 [Molorchus minor]|uniref:Uncharacterized protein n=1 Tax=Molorchus minor TaxID=1323400 RepID=A0ABQ9K2E8_9CUCU|nr:hypothetical protein NQ317_012248 [Molorchus minor]
MLVNFNNHYDNKSKQVEELQVAFSTKDKIIKEQRLRTEELLREFEEYKQKFNSEVQDKLKHELFLANNKIEELEKSIRKANKNKYFVDRKGEQSQYWT